MKLADEALHREYGITSEMQTYFRRSVMDNDGHPLVCYESFDNFIYVLGNYYAVIKDGKAWVKEADCPDKICAKHRPISRSGESIICLPHKLVITVVNEKETDGIDAKT